MWEIKKNNKANVIMELECDDFASLRIEKKTRNSVECYILYLNIYSILNEELLFYNMNDLTKVLTYAKKSIEDFEQNIDSMTDDEYDIWIEKFLQKINEY